jgi:hypothetical protein
VSGADVVVEREGAISREAIADAVADARAGET